MNSTELQLIKMQVATLPGKYLALIISFWLHFRAFYD